MSQAAGREMELNCITCQLSPKQMLNVLKEMRRLFWGFENKQRPIFEIEMNITVKNELVQGKHWDKMPTLTGLVCLCMGQTTWWNR